MDTTTDAPHKLTSTPAVRRAPAPAGERCARHHRNPSLNARFIVYVQLLGHPMSRRG
jgi:hypothetical protein